MDQVNSEQDHGETFLKVTDDRKRRWNSFRKGKKQIKKLWKSKKASKLADEDRSSYSEDSHENMANDDHSMSESMSLPRSTTSSHDPIPSIMLHLPPVFTNSSPDYMAATTDEDDSSRESHNVSRPKSRNPSRSEVALSPELSPQQESNGSLQLSPSNGSLSAINSSKLPNSPSIVSLAKLWMVHVELISGHRLAIRDRSGTSDPYVKIRLGNQRHKTRVISRDLNPVWNESFSFTINTLDEPLIFKVYDHDWGTLDDFMGRAVIELESLATTQEEQELQVDLEDRSSKEELGYLMIKLKIESGMTSVSHKNVKLQKSTQSKRQSLASNKYQIWDSVLMVTLLRGRSLPAMDDNGFSDPYCKFKLGTQKYRSKVIHKSLDPEWKERFELRIYEGQSKILTVEAWDRDIAAKDDYMGKCQVDLADLELDVTHNLVLDLDVGVGHIHMQLCITGTANQQSSLANGHVMDSQQSHEETNWEQIIKKYSIPYTMKNLKDVGFLQVSLNSAESLTCSGHCNPFAVLEVGNTRVRTQTLYKTHNPIWDKKFNFNIKDVHDDLEVYIFSGDKHTELLGRVCIPLLKLVNGKKKAYALKNKHCLQRSHGSVFLTCHFAYNNVRAAIRSLSPREAKVLDEEPKLNRKRLMKNIRRMSSQIETVYSAIQFVNSLFQWTNYLHSSLAFVAFVLLSLYGEWWMPFMMFVMVFIYQYIAVGVFFQQTKGLLEHSPDESTDSESEFSELDNDEDLDSSHKPNERKMSIRQRLKQFQHVLIIIQNTLDQIASTVERVYKVCEQCECTKNYKLKWTLDPTYIHAYSSYMCFGLVPSVGVEFLSIHTILVPHDHLFNWSVPFCSMLAVIILCTAATLFYFIPPNYIVLAWGVNKFSKRLLRPNYIPNNELLDFISRLPSDEELLMHKELRPHLLSRKKKPMKGSTKSS